MKGRRVGLWDTLSWAMLIALCAGLLSGCANTKTVQSPETTDTIISEPEQNHPDAAGESAQENADAVSSEPEDEDHLLLSVNAMVDGDRTLRLDAVGKMRVDLPEHCGIREVRVYEDGRLLQTIQTAEALSDGATNGTASSNTTNGAASNSTANGTTSNGALGPDYAESPTVENALRVRDMNFDGSDDMDLTGWVSNRSEPHYYWLWNSALNRYVYAFTFEDVEPDPQTRELVVTGHDDGISYVERYRYEDGLTAVSREIEDWDNGTEDFPLRAYYEYPDGVETLIREEFTDYDDEGRTIREVRERVNGEMLVTRLEELDVTDGVMQVIRTEIIPVPESDAVSDADTSPGADIPG